MQAIIGQELRARYETPQEVPREMLQLLAHLDEQAGTESQNRYTPANEIGLEC
jgi:hypothetical protein